MVPSFRLITALLVFLVLFGPNPVKAEGDPPAKKMAAIVIDDFGNGMPGTEQMLKLQAPITIAVMPFLPTTKKDAERAHELGYEVILHMPMEPFKGKKSWLGPGAITTDLNDEEIRRRVNEAIDEVPHVAGINNHMGSKATSDERVMRIVLEVCKERNLFFLDSRTAQTSVIGKLAKELGVKTVDNQLFLDEVYTSQHINKQMMKFIKHVQSHDVSMAIGHVGPPGLKTAAAIESAIPDIKNFAEIVPVSKLVK